MGNTTPSGDSAVTTQLQIEHVPIGGLRTDPANPRRISDAELEALTRSIREFGLVDPVIARRDGKIVIGGHQRLLAARKLGLTTIPVIFIDLPEEQARLLNVALNKISGEWDEELLAHLLADLGDGADLTLSGFGDDEPRKLLKSLDSREKRERVESFDIEAALEAAQAAPGAKRGDLWALGDHRLLCGDSTKERDVTRLLDSRKAQMAFTDPPYNVSLGDHGGQQRGTRKRRLENDALSPEDWEAFCEGWAKNLLRSVDGALYVCMAVSEQLPVLFGVLEAAGAHWANMIVWAKDRFLLGRADYHWQYEPIWYGWREGVKRHWCGDRDQSNVWRIARPSTSEAHPTMKPLELVERAIENSSKRGDVVLDLFLGSGSTLIAAERTGRACYGLEIDPHYCKIVIVRWEAFTGQTATKEGSDG